MLINRGGTWPTCSRGVGRRNQGDHKVTLWQRAWRGQGDRLDSARWFTIVSSDCKWGLREDRKELRQRFHQHCVFSVMWKRLEAGSCCATNLSRETNGRVSSIIQGERLQHGLINGRSESWRGRVWKAATFSSCFCLWTLQKNNKVDESTVIQNGEVWNQTQPSLWKK